MFITLIVVTQMYTMPKLTKLNILIMCSFLYTKYTSTKLGEERSREAANAWRERVICLNKWQVINCIFLEGWHTSYIGKFKSSYYSFNELLNNITLSVSYMRLQVKIIGRLFKSGRKSSMVMQNLLDFNSPLKQKNMDYLKLSPGEEVFSLPETHAINEKYSCLTSCYFFFRIVIQSVLTNFQNSVHFVNYMWRTVFKTNCSGRT